MNLLFKKFFRSKLLLALLVLMPSSTLILSFQTKIPIELSITDIRSENGQFVIGIHKDANSFDKETPNQKFVIKKAGIKNGVQKVMIYLEPGVYGITLLDDEDNDTKMNYNFFGLPTEGFGFPNYYHTGFSRPTFDDFKLTISSKTGQSYVVKLRYI